jgi:hypothetical protein
MVKNYKVYNFAIKRLKDYHDYSMEKYLKHQPEGECYIPIITKVDQIIDIIKERGYFWRNPQEMENNMEKLLGEYFFRYNMNDYFDVTKAKGSAIVH